MRIIGGAWRGRRLVAPAGQGTRPTADRVRQALFDRLLHAPWAGREAIEGATVLDVFAGTGAFGLEALSRGAASAVFIEREKAALDALRTNVAGCRAQGRSRVLAADALKPPPGSPVTLSFLDPPYGQELVPRAVAALMHAGWIGAATLIIAELGEQDRAPEVSSAAEWRHGAARMIAWRLG